MHLDQKFGFQMAPSQMVVDVGKCHQHWHCEFQIRLKSSGNSCFITSARPTTGSALPMGRGLF